MSRVGASPDRADKAADGLAGHKREFAEIKRHLRVLK
jgi:hypothetical protein